jgi:hypothetical protein
MSAVKIGLSHYLHHGRRFEAANLDGLKSYLICFRNDIIHPFWHPRGSTLRDNKWPGFILPAIV